MKRDSIQSSIGGSIKSKINSIKSRMDENKVTNRGVSTQNQPDSPYEQTPI